MPRYLWFVLLVVLAAAGAAGQSFTSDPSGGGPAIEPAKAAEIALRKARRDARLAAAAAAQQAAQQAQAQPAVTPPAAPGPYPIPAPAAAPPPPAAGVAAPPALPAQPPNAGSTAAPATQAAVPQPAALTQPTTAVDPAAQTATGAGTATAANPVQPAAATGPTPAPDAAGVPHPPSHGRRKRRSPAPGQPAPSPTPTATLLAGPPADNKTAAALPGAAATPGAASTNASAPNSTDTSGARGGGASKGTAPNGNGTATATPGVNAGSNGPPASPSPESGAKPPRTREGGSADANDTATNETNGNKTGTTVPVTPLGILTNHTIVTPQSNTGAIVGAVLGALAGLLLLIGIAACIACSRRKRLRQQKDTYANAKGGGLPSWLPWGKKPQSRGPHHPPGSFKQHGPSRVHVRVDSNPRSKSMPPGYPPPRPDNNGYNRDGHNGGGYPPAIAGRDHNQGRGYISTREYSSDREYSSNIAGQWGGPAAAGVAAAAGMGTAMGDGGRRRTMSIGYTGDELQEGLKGLRYILTNKLLPAVDNASLTVDPVAAWIDAGMSEARPLISNVSYGASHTFIEDWRTHRVWDWLNQNFWVLIPTDKRLLDGQVHPNLSQQDYARQMLHEIKRNPRFEPFMVAVDDAVDALIQDAVRVSELMGVLPRSMSDSSAQRLRDQASFRPSSVEAAETHYKRVLTELLEAALKFHLQVQGTSETAYIFVPGSPPAVNLPVPERGLKRKDRLGGRAAMSLQYFCESPGVFSEDPRATGGVAVWAPAYAIRAGLNQQPEAY